MVRKVTNQPLQESLGFIPAKQPRQKAKAYAPSALRASQVIDNEPPRSQKSAGQLLDWIHPNFEQNLALKVSSRNASLLLQIFPPTVCALGNKRWGCGNTQLTAALLQCLPIDELVEVRFIDPEHPLAFIQLPIHTLLRSLPIEELLPSVYSLGKLLGDLESPSQENLASVFGVSQSKISRSLKKLDLTAK